MNELVSHIEFLLHEHNCVIIPGFGGFVVNPVHSRRDGVATFLAPTNELVFNRDLTHNDGLLAESYMKSNQIVFEAAMQQIERAVEELKHQLLEQRHVELGKLGSFTMSDEKRFVYTPANFVRPSFFGLNRASLKPIIQMQTTTVPSQQIGRDRQLRSAGMNIAAVAAVLLLVFLLPVSDTTIKRQSAQMIAETSLFGIKQVLTNEQKTTVKSETHSLSAPQNDTTVNVTSAAPLAPTTEEPTGNGPRFYVVMGVYEFPKVAQKMVETLHNEGFTQTGLLQRSGRIDVYAASFTDRTEAEAFLREIHKQYSTHSDAWILKR